MVLNPSVRCKKWHQFQLWWPGYQVKMTYTGDVGWPWSMCRVTASRLPPGSPVVWFPVWLRGPHRTWIHIFLGLKTSNYHFGAFGDLIILTPCGACSLSGSMIDINSRIVCLYKLVYRNIVFLESWSRISGGLCIWRFLRIGIPQIIQN